MANELKNAMDELKTQVDAITDVQKASLGQPLTALPSSSHNKCEAFIYLLSGARGSTTYSTDTEEHRVEVRFYWLLTPINSQVVEQSASTMWDRVMTKFHGDDADRNLTETATLAEVGGGGQIYNAGFQEIGGKLHRLLTVPFEITLDTHGV